MDGPMGCSTTPSALDSVACEGRRTMSEGKDTAHSVDFTSLPARARQKAVEAMQFVVAQMRLRSGKYPFELLAHLKQAMYTRDVPAEHADAIIEWLRKDDRGLRIADKNAKQEAQEA